MSNDVKAVLDRFKNVFAVIKTDLMSEPRTFRYIGHEMQVLGSSIFPGGEYRVTLRHDFRSDIIGQEPVIAKVEVPKTCGICLRYPDVSAFLKEWVVV